MGTMMSVGIAGSSSLINTALNIPSLCDFPAGSHGRTKEKSSEPVVGMGTCRFSGSLRETTLLCLGSFLTPPQTNHEGARHHRICPPVQNSAHARCTGARPDAGLGWAPHRRAQRGAQLFRRASCTYPLAFYFPDTWIHKIDIAGPRKIPDAAAAPVRTRCRVCWDRRHCATWEHLQARRPRIWIFAGRVWRAGRCQAG